MGRRYSVATYLRRLAPLQDEFNLTSDVIVGFPAEDERAFATTLATVARGGPHEGARLPVLAAARHGDRARRPGASEREEGARRATARRYRTRRVFARWRTKIGRDDIVLVDRPGRGYGDDYSPWLVDASVPIGEFVRVRGASVTDEGVLAA